MLRCAAGRARPPSGVLVPARQRLVDAPVLRGEFEQRKTVKGFKHPLVSRGDFLVARERGVVWQHPRAVRIHAWSSRASGCCRARPTARWSSRVDTRDEPALRTVNEMLFALMAADLQALAQRFRVEGELQGGDGWRLVLVPRDAALARWVSRIELEGDRLCAASSCTRRRATSA